MASPLEEFMVLARDQGLTVAVTLFDPSQIVVGSVNLTAPAYEHNPMLAFEVGHAVLRDRAKEMADA